MEIITSYFYQIRFFTPNIIPLSTAAFDPAWYHTNGDYKSTYVDKNGVLIGCRAEPFVPDFQNMAECGGKTCKADPHNCAFLRDYYLQLKCLDYKEMMERFESIGHRVKDFLQFKEDPVAALIVYEKPEQLCSERLIIQKWFNDHDYEIKEFSKI